MRRSAYRRSTGERRMEQAEFARDQKREQGMCAYATCSSSHNLKEGPEGYVGTYGGSMLCEKHYKKVVDYITEHGHLPNE